jgi:hypothetical protein
LVGSAGLTLVPGGTTFAPPPCPNIFEPDDRKTRQSQKQRIALFANTIAIEV